MKHRILFLTIIVIILFLFISCRSVKYVPVETVRVEYKEKVTKDSSYIKEILNVRDSVNYRDSIIQVVDEKGNVFRTEVYKWRDRFHESNYLLKKLQTKYDSLASVRQDTVQVPYPVEKELTRLQRLQMNFGTASFFAVMLLIACWFIRKKFF